MSWVVCRHKGQHGNGLCGYAEMICRIRLCMVADVPVDELPGCPLDDNTGGEPPKEAA